MMMLYLEGGGGGDGVAEDMPQVSLIINELSLSFFISSLSLALSLSLPLSLSFSLSLSLFLSLSVNHWCKASIA